MPELPEVETIARALRTGAKETIEIVGREIDRVELLWERTLAEPDARTFEQIIQGQIVEDVGRRAKYLAIQLSEDVLVIHLRMSGDIIVAKEPTDEVTHPRLVIHFKDGVKLYFNDPRKFGRVWLLEDTAQLFAKLGPEPLDESLTAAQFHEMLAGRKRQLKALLLDQSFLAGLGNIYVDESLFLAHLHPRTRSDEVSPVQAEALLKGIRTVLQEGIRRNGASIDWVYRGGDFQNHFNVYQQTGEPCPVCGTPITRIIIAQRGTHICPNCQAHFDSLIEG
ncbi:MAG: bifunctional DNA-formamidopyrimidine glycosylase/DNA-(apurinic or apyrimidinic site) lyase [Anaerolineales bacterium]|nr:bifunctional DNA-formamidopyrimidine glycosylase/DNA-(apurinic or apyrimidinic site) lyase [Anaerolineales bacterium]